MPDLKISQLPAATTPLAGTELVPIVQGGVTDRTTVEAFLTSTVPSGTANGVLYLNGSKVATSSSALTFDGTGLGVGASPSAARIYARTSATTGTAFQADNGVNTGFIARFEPNTTLFGNDFNQPFAFLINNTEQMRLTSGGNLLVGDTATVNNEKLLIKKNTGAAFVERVWNTATTGDNGFIVFVTEATNTDRGSIDYNRAGGLVRYNTTSDYRAKDIIGPVQNVGATIDALKVYEGVMKGATQSRPMLVAHEVQEHAPYAVSGVKDELNKDGTPKFQQMDVSSLVPLLLAEIQSLRARVAALEAHT